MALKILDTRSVHIQNTKMKTIGAAKFKERCLSILDHLGSEGVVITKRGNATSVVHRVPLLTRDRVMRRSKLVLLA